MLGVLSPSDVTLSTHNKTAIWAPKSAIRRHKIALRRHETAIRVKFHIHREFATFGGLYGQATEVFVVVGFAVIVAIVQSGNTLATKNVNLFVFYSDTLRGL